MPIKLISNNKKVMFIVIMVLTLTIAVFGATVALNIVNNGRTQNNEMSVREQADSLKTQAIVAQKNGKTDEAISLWKQARERYREINDTNSVVDADGMLSTLE
jgi:hypothetical protein